MFLFFINAIFSALNFVAYYAGSGHPFNLAVGVICAIAALIALAMEALNHG